MFEADQVAEVRQVVRARAQSDRALLDALRSEVLGMRGQARAIRPRTTTAVSLVASDGGNNRLFFDPFHVQLVRVTDSYGKQLCLDAVSPTTDTDGLSRAQFLEDGRPRTALGQMMADLGIEPMTLNRLSHMVPSGEKMRDEPEKVSPSWVLVYRDLCEWAALYERICHRSFATDTLIVRDGLLRSKLFRGELFIDFRRRITDAIERIRQEDKRRVFLIGLAKHSKVLDRYRLVLALENVIPAGDPRFVRVPRELEKKAYVWPEYGRGDEESEAEGEAPKFVGGDMFLVRFGRTASDPIWPVDVFSPQVESAPEVFAYLLADAIEGFPIPFYPRCLQKAHEHAEVVDFDLEVLQDEMFTAVRDLVAPEQKRHIDELRLRPDLTGRRYG
jgi:hypothetical protein